MDVHVKIVSWKEAEFYVRASSKNIAPAIVSFKIREDGKVELGTEKYPHTLFSRVREITTKEDLDKIYRDACAVLEDLHSIGIIHGDISEENIVVGDDVRLIDFGMSYSTSEVTEDNFRDLAQEFPEAESYADKYLTGVEYIKSLEQGILGFLEDVYFWSNPSIH